jgi:hypothetical protein
MAGCCFCHYLHSVVCLHESQIIVPLYLHTLPWESAILVQLFWMPQNYMGRVLISPKGKNGSHSYRQDFSGTGPWWSVGLPPLRFLSSSPNGVLRMTLSCSTHHFPLHLLTWVMALSCCQCSNCQASHERCQKVL